MAIFKIVLLMFGFEKTTAAPATALRVRLKFIALIALELVAILCSPSIPL